MLIKLFMKFVCGFAVLVLYAILAVMAPLSMASELPDLEDIDV